MQFFVNGTLWNQYLAFVSLLSSGTTIWALSTVWSTFIDERISKRKAFKESAETFLAALKIELEAMKPWTESPYAENHDWVNDQTIFRIWRAPFLRPINPLVHLTIASAASEGVQRGLDLKFVAAAVELEYQLRRFDRALAMIDATSTSNIVLSESLRRKLEIAPIGQLPPLEIEETTLMNRFFEANRYLHVQCIGSQNDKPNLHTAFREIMSQFPLERDRIEKIETAQTRRERVLHCISTFLAIMSFGIMLSSVCSFQVGE